MVNATPQGGSAAFTVDTDAISSHGGTIGDIANQIENKMNLMQRKLQTLQGQWTGGAANQFTVLYGDWERQQRNVKDSLRRISGALGQTAQDYGDVERGARQRFTPM